MAIRMSVGSAWRTRASRTACLAVAVTLLGLASPLATGTASATPAGCTNTAAITLGAPATSGNIAAAGQVDCYTFSGTTGDRVHVHVVATDGTLVPSTSVADPSDATVCGPTTDADQICTLTADGTQTIEISDSSGTETGGYTVFAEDLIGSCSDMHAITLGAPATTGSIDAAGQVDCYTFSGNSGDRVHVHVVATGGTLVPSTSVVDGTGASVCAATTDADQICTLTSTGTQAIVIQDSTGTETGGYSVFAENLFGSCSDMHAITLGAPATTGSIDAAGQVDCYTFTGNTGDRVHVHAVATDGTLVPSTSLVDASNTVVCGPTTDADQICTLTSDGTQTIELADSSGTGTGGYTVFAENLFGSCSDMHALTLGAPASDGTISAAGQIDCYTFTGTVGNPVHINVTATDGTLVPSTAVVDSTNTTVCGPTTDADQTCHLPASGSYVIEIQDSSATNTGDYTVSADEVPVTCAATRTIGFGTTAKIGSIDGTDVALCYVFSARAGNPIRVRVVTATGALVPNVSVLGPGGGTVCGPSTATEQTCFVGADGTQTIVVRDLVGTNTGTFGVYLQRLVFPRRCTALAFGTTAVSGSITVPGDADCYTFRTGGQRRVRVHIVTLDGSFTPETELIDAHGKTTCGPSEETDLTCPHNFGKRNQMILVRDATGPNTGSYAISLQLFPPAVNCSPIRPGGAAVSGGISVPGSADCYTFQGAYRDRVRLRVVGVSGALVPYIDLIGPGGVTLCGPSTSELTCQLPAAGKWTVMVADQAGPNTGSYAVHLQILNAPVNCRTLNINDPAQTWSITAPANQRCYTFTGTKNQTVRFDVAALDGTLVPRTEVLRPGGTTLCGPSTDPELTCKLNVGGTFTILIDDAVGTGTGDFSVAANSP